MLSYFHSEIKVFEVFQLTASGSTSCTFFAQKYACFARVIKQICVRMAYVLMLYSILVKKR